MEAERLTSEEESQQSECSCEITIAATLVPLHCRGELRLGCSVVTNSRKAAETENVGALAIGVANGRSTVESFQTHNSCKILFPTVAFCHSYSTNKGIQGDLYFIISQTQRILEQKSTLQ